MKLGSAHLPITPPNTVSLLGYDFRQRCLAPGHSGVRDPLYARALALDAEDGQGPALIISLDLCIISVTFARHLRQQVAERCAVMASRILIACSHTHSGPWLAEEGIAEDVAAVLPHVRDGDKDAAQVSRQAYTQGLVQQVIQVAALALGLRTAVDCFLREVPLGIGYNRRVPAGQAAVSQCWNPLEYPELAPLAAADPTLSVLTFRQRGGNRVWSLWCHGTHPVVLGKTSTQVSADWPGAANALLAAQGIEGHFLLGACGDVHPWIATQDDGAGVDLVGHAAGSMVALCAACGGESPQPGVLRLAAQSVVVGGRELDLMAWNIAGMRLVSSPTELFAPLAAALRQRLPGPLMIATNSNGWTGYWPDAKAFHQGGYEIDAARAMGRSPGDSEALIDHLGRLAGEVC